ncbi:MAG: sigma-54-dependent Fis family transcriptional regulator [Bdellovibrionales bacterium]|nr:sigma-54-dependent Fis family transcriptional regulator [Bdellovibrionales bacterium]
MSTDTRSHESSNPAPRLQLLVVDDDDLVIASLRTLLPPGWQLIPGFGCDQSELERRTLNCSAALIDMHLSRNLEQAEGLEVLRTLHHIHPTLELIAMSGDLDRSLMERGLKAGASRFLAKPIGREELRLTLEKIEALVDLRSRSKPIQWIGGGRESQKVLKKIADLKGERGPILIEGESGTGKEVAAQLIHQQDGPGRPFVTVNLGAVPETVFESEFFGHVRGAFTGADQNKPGLIELASGGDLFLDEIEALPLGSQAKLLRFLESGEVRRVGGRDTVKAPVRVIAATNRKLSEMVHQKEFREDLLWRLQGKHLVLPALRDRLDDVGDLARAFLALESPRRNKSLADDALAALKAHTWPGNVRELKRICEQLSLYSPLPILRADDVQQVLPASVAGLSTGKLNLTLGLSELVARFEAQIVREALKASDDDADRASELIGISRSSLYKKMKDYGIERGGGAGT